MRYSLSIFLSIIFLFWFHYEANAQSCGGILPGQSIEDYSPICAPSTIKYVVTYNLVNFGGDPSNVSVEVIWGDDGTASVVYPYDAAPLVPGSYDNKVHFLGGSKFQAELIYTYPAVSTVCSYDIESYMQMQGVRCVTTIQGITVNTWDTDDEGTGELRLEETTTAVQVYQICAGEEATITFTDNSTFNCNPTDHPDYPNQETRWIQFEYGTYNNIAFAGNDRVPQIYLDPSGINLQITDAAGNLNANLNGDGFTTPYRGAVTELPGPVNASGEISLDVYVPPGVSTAGEVFEITLRNWNYCNQYDDPALPGAPADPVDGDNAPIETTALIEIVTTPPDLTSVDRDICVGSPADITVPGTNVTWYSTDPDVDPMADTIHEGNTFDPIVGDVMWPGFTPIDTTSGGPQWTATYYVTQRITDCPSYSVPITIEINEVPQRPTIDITGSTSFCYDGITDVELAVVYPNTASDPVIDSIQWFKDGTEVPGGSGGNDSILYLDQVAQSGDYYVKIIGAPTSYCENSSDPVAIQIDTVPIASITNHNAEICHNTTTNIELDADIAGTTFDWIIVKGANGASAGSGIIGTHIIQTLTNASNDPDTIIYRIIPEGPNPTNCVGDYVDIEVVVHPIPNLLVTNNNPNICSNTNCDIDLDSDVNNVTYSWTVVSGAANGANPGSGNNINETLTNATTSPVTVTYRVTPTGPAPPNCVGSSTDVDVVVYPIPDASSSTNNLSDICHNENTDIDLDADVVGSTLDWVIINENGTGATAGSGNIGDNISQTLVNGGPGDVTVTYRITPTGSAPTNCVGLNVDRDVTVHPLPIPTLVNDDADDIICDGDVVVFTGGGGTNYEFYVNGSLAQANSADDTYDTDTLADGDVVTVLVTDGNSCQAISGGITMTVNPIPVVNPTPTAQSICSGQNANISLASIPGGGTFAWKYYETAALGGADGVGISIVQTLNNGGASYEAATYRIATTLSGCVSDSLDVVVDVSPGAPDVKPIIDGETPVCQDTTMVLYEITNTDTKASTFNWSLIGLPNASFIGNTNNDTVYVEFLGQTAAIGSINVTISNGCSPPVETSDPYVITVNDLPTANDIAVTECSDATEGNTAALDLTVNEGSINGGVGITYSYFTDANLTASVPDETNHTITDGDIIYVLVHDGTCQDTAEIDYTIDPKPTANNQTPTVCSDGTEGNTATVDLTSLDAVIDGGSGYTITYYTDPGLAPANEIGTPTAYLVADAEIIYAKVENGGCQDVATVTYTVNPRPTAIDQNPADICSDAANGNQAVVNLTTLDNSVDGGNGYTINWYTDSNLSSLIPDFTNFNATDGTAIYAKVENGGCQDTATTTYTINPTPNVTNAHLTDEICTTESLNFVPTGDVVGTTFNWTSSVTSGTASGNTASSSGNITDAITNTTTVDAEITYEITPTASGCTGATVNYVVTVHPKPNVNNTDLQDSICSGGSVLFTPTGDVAGTTFNWVSTESSGNLSDPGNGSGVISHNLSNTGTVVENVSYAITPMADGCTGDVVNYVMYVNPVPALSNADLTDEICSGDQLNFIPTGPVVGTTYNWTSSVTTGSVTGRTANSSGNITDILNNTAIITSVVEYTITPVFNSCTGTSQDYEVAVYLYPDINIAPTDAEICTGENTNFSIDADGSDLTYQWQIFTYPLYTNLANGGIYSNVTSDQLDLTNVDISNNGDTYRILITNEGLCVDSSQTANLTVNALPTITSHPDTIDVCVNGDASFDIAPNSPADFNYQWQVDDNNDGIYTDLVGEIAAVLNISGVTIVMDGNKYRCVLDSVASGCQSISEIALLNVNPLPNITDDPDDITICEREDTAFSILPNDALTYNYRWIVDRNDGNGFVNLAADANHADIDLARLQILNADIGMNGYLYRCVITNASTTCRDTSDEATLTMKPLPVTSSISGREDVCVSELAIAYQVTANPASTYTWVIPPEFTSAGGTINFGGGTNSPNHYVSLNYGANPFVGDLYVVETNNGCTGDSVSLELETFEIPVPEAGNDTSICNGNTVVLGETPSATGGSGTYIYQWTPTTYLDDATIANPISTPPITLTYSLKVVDASSGCQSGLDQINITVNNIPTAPTSSDVTICEGEAVPNLFAAGTNIKWYSDEFLSVLEYSGNSFATGQTAVGTYAYWATQTSNNCESEATKVSLAINAIPSNITANDETICYGEPTPVLTASGGTSPQWYANSALTSLVNIGPTYNTGKFAVGVYTYYLTDKVNNCESEPDTVVLTINNVPMPPTSSDITVCQGEPVPDLEATGTDILWYDDAGATSLVSTGNIYSTGLSAPGAYNFYATQTINGCESNIKSVKLTINPSPVITNIQSTNQTACASNDGTITIAANGTPPLTYSIDDEVSFVTNSYFAGLGTGTYPTSVQNYYGCITRGDTIDIASGDVPPAPTAGDDAFYCFGDVIVDITATPISGGAIEWFSDPGLTTQIGTGDTFSPYNTIGETKYYASELAGGCYSLPTAVTITIYDIPAMPVVYDTAVCDGQAIPSLEAIGENIKWYSDAALTLLVQTGNSFTTGHTAVGDYTYYATQTVNNCESSANDVILSINTTPDAPDADDITICFGEPTPDLTASGNNIKWYDDVNLTNEVATGSPYATGETAVGTYQFYVTQTQGQCESEDENVVLTINAIPQEPIVLDTAICDDETVPNLTAEGQNIRWYDDNGLTNMVGSGNSFNTGQSSTGTYNYYVTQTVNNCESDYEISTLIINEKPQPPDAEDVTICFGEAAIVTAIGYNIHWYSDDFGNPLVFTGNPYSTGETAVDEYNYFVSQVVNGCESETEAITLTINPVPLILNQTFTDQTACDSDDGQILVTAKETPPEGESPVEYSIDDGVTYQGTGTFTGLKNGLYPIVVSNGFGCLTYGDTIEIVDGGAPSAPEAGDDSTYCHGSTLSDLYAIASVGGTLTWYYNPILTNVAGTGTALTPKDTIAELTYYITETSGTCESSPTPVEIIIHPVPEKYDFLDDTSYCAGDLGVTLQLDSSAYFIEYQLMQNGFAYGVEKFGTGIEITWDEILEGEYYVVATDTSSGCFAIMNDTVEVIENPLPNANFTMDTDQGCSPLFVNFNQLSEETGTYIWNFDDGVIDSITEDPSHNFVNETSVVRYFEVYLQAITGSGCVDSISEFVTVYPLPDYDFAVIPDSACHPATVQFSTQPGAESYKWDFGNGPQSGDYTVSYAFNNYTQGDMTFPVQLVAVSPGFGCVDTVNKDVVVHPEPVADFELDAYNGCTPFTVHITNNSSGNIQNYYWDYGNNTGVDTTSAAQFEYTYYNEQTYEAVFDLRLTVETEDGCTSVASPRTVRVYPEVVANFIADTIGCSPLQIQFDNRSYGNDIVSNWDFGDGQFTSTNNPIHEFVNNINTSEFYTVQLVVRSNQYFCTDTMERTVEVYPSPVADFIFTPESPLLYPATTIYITDETNEGNWDYFWEFGDGNSSTASGLNNYEYVYDTSGVYWITLRVSSENCWDTVSYPLEIHLPPPEVTISPSAGGCSPLEIQFINNTIYADQFKWEFGDGSISYAHSPQKTYYETGIYLVKMTATGPGGVVESDPLEVEVFNIPFADFGVTPILVYLPRGEVQTINRSDNADVYRWNFGNDTISTAENPKIIYAEEGVYDITLWAMTNTEPQCVDSITKTAAVTVEDPNDIRFMNAFMPGNLDGQSGDLNFAEFFPVIKKGGIEEFELQVFNRWGELVFESKDVNLGWNGKFMNTGRLMEQDVYVWKVYVKYDNGEYYHDAGDVTLLR